MHTLYHWCRSALPLAGVCIDRIARWRKEKSQFWPYFIKVRKGLKRGHWNDELCGKCLIYGARIPEEIKCLTITKNVWGFDELVCLEKPVKVTSKFEGMYSYNVSIITPVNFTISVVTTSYHNADVNITLSQRWYDVSRFAWRGCTMGQDVIFCQCVGRHRATFQLSGLEQGQDWLRFCLDLLGTNPALTSNRCVSSWVAQSTLSKRNCYLKGSQLKHGAFSGISITETGSGFWTFRDTSPSLSATSEQSPTTHTSHLVDGALKSA